MVISKTPVRISFFGGGTDYPDYFNRFKGAVLSTTIDKFVYVTVNRISGLLDHKYRIAYSKQELCNDVNEIQHPVVRETIKYLNIHFGLEINVISDLPARTGIGSSSSFTVGLLHALYGLLNISKSKEELAKEAIHIEYDILKENVGVQDQLAAAYGGFNHMSFSSNGLLVEPLQFSVKRMLALESNLLMFYTGVTRFASEVLKEQVAKTKEKALDTKLSDIYTMVKEGKRILMDDAIELDEFGELMNKTWMLKKQLSNSITNTDLDRIYQLAISAGAIGGKLLGAGGGGFFIFYVPTLKHNVVREALKEYQEVDFRFDGGGTKIIYPVG